MFFAKRTDKRMSFPLKKATVSSLFITTTTESSFTLSPRQIGRGRPSCSRKITEQIMASLLAREAFFLALALRGCREPNPWEGSKEREKRLRQRKGIHHDRIAGGNRHYWYSRCVAGSGPRPCKSRSATASLHEQSASN